MANISILHQAELRPNDHQKRIPLYILKRYHILYSLMLNEKSLATLDIALLIRSGIKFDFQAMSLAYDNKI